MIKSKTSKLYFKCSAMTLWEAVTSQYQNNGIKYTPMSIEEYESTSHDSLKNGKFIAKVTDMTPGKRCAYVLKAEKFDVSWIADFQDTPAGECLLIINETYDFRNNLIPWLLAKLFLNQGRQHKDYARILNDKLQEKGAL